VSKRKKLLAISFLVVAGLLTLMVLFPPKRHGPTWEQLQKQLDSALQRGVQRLYRHEILSLYDPPAEAFTEDGYSQLRQIQTSHSKVFIPYLVSGATLAQPDVLYNPFFDLFILLEDREGLINSIVLASSLSGGQTPLKDVKGDYWQQMYRRYQVARLTTFTSPRPFSDFPYINLQLRNLTNQYSWPARIPLTTAKVPFDLYLQQPGQAVYCTSLEPGAYVIFNVVSNRLRTNLMVLPPYGVYQVQRQIQDKIDQSNDEGRRLLQGTQKDGRNSGN
jgi:hypothetical protein